MNGLASIEKGNITNPQLYFLIVGFILGSNVILSAVESIAKHDGWISLLTGLVVALPFILAIGLLAQSFPGKTLVEMNDIIYGPLIGKIISSAYLLFFLQLAAFNLRDYGDFLNNTVLPKTPLLFLLIIILLVCCFAVKKGIELIAQTSFIIIAFAILEIITTIVLLVTKMDINNFLPIFKINMKEFIQTSHVTATIAFGEPVVFLMLTAFVTKSKQIKKVFIVSLLIGGGLLTIAVMRDIAVLGDTGSINLYPSYQAIQSINFGFLARIEIFHSSVILYVRVLKLCILLYATVLGLAQLLKLQSYKPLVIPVSILILLLSLIHYENYQDNFVFATQISPFYFFPFIHLIPLVSLFLVKIKSLKKENNP